MVGAECPPVDERGLTESCLKLEKQLEDYDVNEIYVYIDPEGPVSLSLKLAWYDECSSSEAVQGGINQSQPGPAYAGCIEHVPLNILSSYRNSDAESRGWMQRSGICMATVRCHVSS
jgi:hypothetical protein